MSNGSEEDGTPGDEDVEVIDDGEPVFDDPTPEHLVKTTLLEQLELPTVVHWTADNDEVIGEGSTESAQIPMMQRDELGVYQILPEGRAFVPSDEPSS